MSDWQTFLDAQGARLEPNGETHFAADDTPLDDNTTYLCELGYQGLIALDGPEATSFLQGQVTCDTRTLLDGRWCAGAQCNLKGRMFGSFTLAARDPDAHHLLMRTHGETRQTLQTGLAKYAVFSRVELADASDDWRRLGLAGPEAAELLRQQTDLEPAVGEYAYTDTLVALRLAEERFELWVSGSVAQQLWLTLSETCRLAGSNFWQLADIRDGLGAVRAQTSETFTPQSLNYQLIDAVSFKKGCYTGQEVVARLHYKGKLKKHMYRIGFDWDGPLPDPGTAIVNADGKNRGDLVMSARAGKNRIEALAVLPAKDAEPLQVDPAGAKIERLSLPYAIPTGDNDA